MHKIFTNFASSRFVDQKAVVSSLRTLAMSLRDQSAEIRAVYLFGSFATGHATPRSDADVVVEIPEDMGAVNRKRLSEFARTTFLEAPVPVDVFILDSERMQEDWGIAAAVAREGIKLA